MPPAGAAANAEPVLFVDDRPENVEAAIAFGFHGHLHRDPETLERLLRDWNLTDEDLPLEECGTS